MDGGEGVLGYLYVRVLVDGASGLRLSVGVGDLIMKVIVQRCVLLDGVIWRVMGECKLSARVIRRGGCEAVMGAIMLKCSVEG